MSQQVPPPYTDNPPPYGFQPPPPMTTPATAPGSTPAAPAQIMVVHEPPRTVLVTPALGLGSTPVQTVCPSCRQNIESRVDQEIASRAHLTALLFCLFGCWFCVWLPYCMDSCKNTNHYCPHCKAFLGTFVAG